MSAINAINAILSIQNIQRQSRRRKIYRIRGEKIMKKLPDLEFKRKYGFDKITIRNIINLIEEKLAMDRRGASVSPELQVLVAISCWGRREIQDDTADFHGLSQPTVSRTCAKVARALADFAKQFIKMPRTDTEQEEVINNFKKIKNFPGIIGAIDCTYVELKRYRSGLARDYLNSKGDHSLNVQVICGTNLKILDIFVKWRGNTPDNHIFNESQIKQRFENGEFRGCLLGDSEYPQLPYLFTPVIHTSIPAENKYNVSHTETLNTVNQCFEVWKQRFPCLLHGISVSLENAKNLIIALGVLHNIAIDMNDIILDEHTFTVPVQETVDEDIGTKNTTRDSVQQLLLENFIRQNFDT